MLGELAGTARSDGGLDMSGFDDVRMIVLVLIVLGPLGPYCVEPRRKCSFGGGQCGGQTVAPAFVGLFAIAAVELDF